MSGSTIGGVVGGVIGFYVGGPTGAYYGWMIGSAVGGYVDPVQIEGPRLRDIRGQSASVGGSIPRAWGSAPVPCNIIWQQEGVTEHEHTDSGKSGTEQVTFTYTRSYAVMFHLGEIAGILQIKRNGKLVYDARTDEAIVAEYLAARGTGTSPDDAVRYLRARRAMNSRWISRAVIYTGTQTQEPDPTIEAHLGVGNVPAYRGRAYMVVTDDDVTAEAGAIPQFEIVVAVCGETGTVAGTGAAWLAAYALSGDSSSVEISPNGDDWSEAGVMPNWAPTSHVSIARTGDRIVMVSPSVSTPGSSGIYSADRGETWAETDLTSASCDDVVTDGTRFWVARGPKKSNDGLTYVSPATPWPSSGLEDSLCMFGGRLIAYAPIGVGMICRADDATGDSATQLENLPLTQNLLGTRMATSGSLLALVGYQPGLIDAGAENDYHPVLLTTADPVDGFEELPLPFEDKINPGYATRMYIHYSSSLGLWAVSFYNRIALGTSLGFLTLSSFEFPGDIQSIDSDSGRLMVAAGPLFKTDNFITWEEIEGSPAGSLGVHSLLDGAAGIPIPDAPGWYTNGDGSISGGSYEYVAPCDGVTLGEIVAEVCELSGLTADEYDVSELTDVITGYVIARETDAASVIESLRPIGMFDPAEWDGKARFVKRGGVAVGSINDDDLVERDGDAIEREIVAEHELLRRVTTGHIDPIAGFANSTQKYERRAGTVKAMGEASFEISAVMSADQAATVSKRRVLTSWGEPEKQKASLYLKHAKYTPTDVLNYTNPDGDVEQWRLMQIEDDSGVRELEASTNCPEAYNATATGVAPRPPTVIDPGLLGHTELVVMDLPLWRTTDADDLGLYGAARGVLAGWHGAQIDISTDGGATYARSVQVTQQATIGYTTTALTAWASSENPEEQEVTVWLPRAPSSVTYEVMLGYANKAAVQNADGSWEILQYQTVTALGDGLYTLSGLLRGRFNTTPGVVDEDADFVLLDDAVQFVPVERDLIGESITVRATSYGTSSDAAVPFVVPFTDAASQTEWPVHMVEASRDGSDNVSVSCVIRDRLGTETSRYPSTHFIGLRFTYTDGVDSFAYDVSAASIGTSSYGTHTYTAAQQTTDFGSVPGSLTVTVAPLNDITGAGPSSAGVTV